MQHEATKSTKTHEGTGVSVNEAGRWVELRDGLVRPPSRLRAWGGRPTPSCVFVLFVASCWTSFRSDEHRVPPGEAHQYTAAQDNRCGSLQDLRSRVIRSRAARIVAYCAARTVVALLLRSN